MAQAGDYESLLRSLSGLPQQFGHKSRHHGTPPNPLMPNARPSSRVTKPLSATSSPVSKASQQRRRALTARTASAHATPYKSRTSLNRQPRPAWSQAATDNAVNGYPWNWHANAHLTSMWNSFPASPEDSYVASSAALPEQEAFPQWSGVNYGWPSTHDHFHQPQPQDYEFSYLPWTTNANYSFPHDLSTQLADQRLDNHSGFNHIEPSSARENKVQSAAGATDEEGFSGDHEGDLVGMGLYDRESRAHSQPALLLGASLEEHEPVRSDDVPSMLEEGWAPPADQVPDAEADEGPETPVMSSHQTWMPSYGAEAGYGEDAMHMPYNEHSNFGAADDFGCPVVYDWQGNIVDPEALASQQQAMASGWYGNDWQQPLGFTSSPYS